MIGWVLIYFIGKAFYDLAKVSEKSQWGYGIAGVVVYYAGIFLGAFIFGILRELHIVSFFDDISDTVLGLMGIPIGLLSCYIFYKILKNKWSKSNQNNHPDVLDSEYI
jgi:hypothetical protein